MSDGQERSRRRLRLLAWIVVAAGALAAPLMLGGGGPDLLAAGWSLAWLSAMGLLLVTTPAGAIRLPSWASALCVGAGALWLVWAGGAEWERAQLFVSPAVGAILMWLFAQTAEGRRWLGCESPAPGSAFWWFALWAWHPLVWLPQGGGWRALLGAALAVGVLLTERAPGSARVLGAAVWAGAVAGSMVVASGR